MADAVLRVVALGGISEIGRNMTVFEHRLDSDGSRLLVVDCGMLLGKTNSPGVDLTLPDWSYFRDRLADIDAIVLTHGHEDHIGALPYLLRERADIPLIGSRLTLALVSAKLDQHHIRPQLQQVREGETTTVGPWGLRFYRGQPFDPGRAGSGDPGRQTIRCSTPATSRWTRRHSMAG